MVCTTNPCGFSLTYKIFSFNWRSTIITQMKLIGVQCSKDLKFKFLACHILDFYKNHMRSTNSPTLSLISSKQYVLHYILLWTVVLQNTVCWEYAIFTTVKSLLVIYSSCQLHLTLIHLFVITNNIRCLINKLWLLAFEFSWFFFSVLLRSLVLNHPKSNF